MQTFYADGIANVRLIDGVFRLDLVTVSEVKAEQVASQPNVSLAMSLPALLRMQQQIETVLSKLVEQGVLKRREDPAAVTAPVQTTQ